MRAVVDTTLPTIVCLCGSTRFWRAFQHQSLMETMDGRIVLSIGAASGTDDEHFGNLPKETYDHLKGKLDALHKRKIELADEVLVLNVDGYIGESTASEIAYAYKLGRNVRWLAHDADGFPQVDTESTLRIGQAEIDLFALGNGQ